MALSKAELREIKELEKFIDNNTNDKHLYRKVENLQVQTGAALILFSELREIPYPTRRALKSRLVKLNKAALSLRKMVAGY